MPALSVSDAHLAGGWCLACLASHATLSALFTPRTVPRLSRLSPREQGSLRNTVVAAVHAAIMFVGSASYLAPHWDTLLAPLTRHSPLPVAGNSPVERFYCSLMLGYLVYDTLYGLVARNNGVDMVAHHLVGFGAWVALLLADRGGFYMMWVQLAEVRPRGVWQLAVSLLVWHAERGEVHDSLRCSLVTLTHFAPPDAGLHPVPACHHRAVQAGPGRHDSLLAVRRSDAGDVHAPSHGAAAPLPPQPGAEQGPVGHQPAAAGAVLHHGGHLRRIQCTEHNVVAQTCAAGRGAGEEEEDGSACQLQGQEGRVKDIQQTCVRCLAS